MPDKFTVRGVEWRKYHPTALETEVGDSYIQVWKGLEKDEYDFLSPIHAGAVTATSIEEAAALAFDACHKKASELCDAFTESLRRERVQWFEGLPGEDRKECPCGAKVSLVGFDLASSYEIIDHHFGHKGEEKSLG